MNIVRLNFCLQNCEKVKVIRDYAKSISYFTMDNECHENICVVVQNSPHLPYMLLTKNKFHL